jgi:hypothetical protein
MLLNRHVRTLSKAKALGRNMLSESIRRIKNKGEVLAFGKV